MAFACVGALLLGPAAAATVLGPVLFVGGAALVGEFALREYAVRGLVARPRHRCRSRDAAGWAGLVLDPLFFPVLARAGPAAVPRRPAAVAAVAPRGRRSGSR